MITISEIKDIRETLISDIHANRLKEQNTDISYYEDTNELPLLKDSKYVVRTGAVARMIDNVTEQVVTNSPVVYREPTKKGKQAEDSAISISSWLNLQARRLNRANPNRFKESIKNSLVCGENWLYVVLNENYSPEKYPNELPFDVLTPHPLVVFFDPRMGEKDGVPNRVIVYFNRNVSDIRRVYPSFVPYGKEKKIPFLMYYDNEARYFEAGNGDNRQPLLRDKDNNLSNGSGLQENIFKCVPFVHSYSGFGKESQDGDPASLAVGRVRKIRGIYAENTTIRSNVHYIIHKYAHPNRQILNKSGAPISPEELNELDFGAGVIQDIMLPEGADLQTDEGLVPPPEVFTYLAMTMAEINNEDPAATHGIATGTSGRQEDVLKTSGLKLYDSIIFNTSNAYATAFGMGMKMCEKAFSLPPKIDSNDIAENYQCSVELKAEDPLELSRSRAEGYNLWKNGAIPYEEFAIRYMGKTQEEAKKMKAQIWIEEAQRNSPSFQQLIIQTAAEEMGKEEELSAIDESMNPKSRGVNTIPDIGSRGGQPRLGNIQTEQGQEMADQSIMHEPRVSQGVM
jgi:hypothetical protein